ncbi:MAG: MFS transporter [Myxococcota bacterium]
MTGGDSLTPADRRAAAAATRPVWVVLVGCFVCQMGLGSGYVFGTTLKHIVTEFEWSRAAFAAANAPVLMAMGLSAPLVGALSERIGARAVLSGATVLLGCTLLLLGRMENLWEFFVLSALFGVGMTGVGDVVVGAVAAGWVRARRGLALAFVYVGSNVGGAFVPIYANWVAEREGWREALFAVGLLAMAVILPFALFAVRESPRLEPVEEGSVEGGAGEGEDGESRDLDLRQALRTRSFWALVVVLLSFYFYYMALIHHLVAFLSDRGMSDARAAASLSFAVALGVVSKLAIGALADRIPGKPSLVLNFAVLTAGSWVLLVADRPGWLPVFLVAHGFATAAENVVLPLTVADCFGTRHMARIYGALMVTLFPGGVLGPIFAGAVFDRTGRYDGAFVTFGVLNLLGLAALGLVRAERGRGAGQGAPVRAEGGLRGPA